MEQDVIDVLAAGIAAYCLSALMRGLTGRPLFDLLDALILIAADLPLNFHPAAVRASANVH